MRTSGIPRGVQGLGPQHAAPARPVSHGARRTTRGHTDACVHWPVAGMRHGSRTEPPRVVGRLHGARAVAGGGWQPRHRAQVMPLHGLLYVPICMWACMRPTQCAVVTYSTAYTYYLAVRRYAWAIPDERALRIVAHFGPIVEVWNIVSAYLQPYSRLQVVLRGPHSHRPACTGLFVVKCAVAVPHGDMEHGIEGE